MLLPSSQTHSFKWYPDFQGTGRNVALTSRIDCLHLIDFHFSLSLLALVAWLHFASLPALTYSDGWSLKEHDISL